MEWRREAMSMRCDARKDLKSPMVCVGRLALAEAKYRLRVEGEQRSARNPVAEGAEKRKLTVEEENRNGLRLVVEAEEIRSDLEVAVADLAPQHMPEDGCLHKLDYGPRKLPQRVRFHLLHRQVVVFSPYAL
jgi:hypothetical protein